MRAHITKSEFKFVAISVMVLEVSAFLVFIFGTLGAILGTYRSISTTDFILLGFGGIFIALTLLATAELLQLVMRIEFNTRKENAILMAQTRVQQAEVKATKSIASALKKTTRKRAVKKSVPRKTSVKKPLLKKVKPRKRK